MITLINPAMVVLARDPMTTGVVYMPFTLAYLGASLRQAGHAVTVIDAFGEAPRSCQSSDDFLIFGLTVDEVVARVPADTRLVFLHAINLLNHNSTIAIVEALKQCRPDLTVVLFENTQAVTAYSLREVADQFYDVGADYVLTGECEHRGIQLANALLAGDAPAARKIDGVGCPGHYTPPDSFIKELDDLPFPAWDLLPVENYWSLKFSHGPLSADRYLPLLTSRGCPYSCRFCVVPTTNETKWRARSPKSVVDEMEFWIDRFGVREFHFEDLNPTVNEKRTRALCEEIIRRGVDVSWKLVSGTKVETIKSGDTVALMAKAGCRYVSISPETGSPELLKKIVKPFNLDHAVRVVSRMKQEGIYTQACFVLGFPGESDEDREMTRQLVLNLTRRGIDEIALFIVSPVPGSAIFNQLSGYQSLSALNFSPSWREDYPDLSAFRRRLYREFLFTKLRCYPLSVLAQCWRFLSRSFETKMEMVPYRAMRYRLTALTATPA